MISTRIKFGGGKMRLIGVGFQKYQMAKLGAIGLASLKERVSRGIGSDDSPMPPLTRKNTPIMRHGKFVRQRVAYANWKGAHGLQPFRDLRGTGKEGGHMIDNLTVRSASETEVKIALTKSKQRAKAISNERRTPWCSWSDRDQRAIIDAAVVMFKTNVEGIASAIRRARRAA
jgi:hypothetical protein